MTRGDRVLTPLGPGTVAYVRMAPPDYREVEAVSVVLDGIRDRWPNYTGSTFPVDKVSVTPREED